MFAKTFVIALAVALAAGICAQDTQQADTKDRAKAVRDYAKSQGATIEKLATYLSDPDIDVRVEAVKGIDEIGGAATIDPLVRALADNDPEVQIRATDGLVNFYLPGYLQKGGLTAPFRRAGSAIKAHFTDTNDQVIDPYVEVRPDVIMALGKVVTGAASMHARANAARAIGILRGRAAIPDLLSAMRRSKDDEVMYESLIALQKIHDPTVAPQITWMLRDLSDRIQVTALETTGLLQNRAALPDVRDALNRAHNNKVRRAALEAIALMPDDSVHGVLVSYLNDKDDALRASAAEGLARLKNPADLPALEKMFNTDKKTAPRLAAAFGMVNLGRLEGTELGPLRYLVNQLNSVGYRETARPYLVELARDPAVRQSIYPLLQGASRDEKTGLADVLARSGGPDALPYLQTISRDPDTTVAEAGVRALKTLQARTSRS
ncbi:MAG TPA: HEAT repeat domain-containing protein [Bryobacteraceae bacterium]|nr:HEAT repeat domain-containing protein [Bryobacteraceae bacterium]